ncbi:MAG: hypothetical protein WA949_18970 [Phormidesmis sp.]
MPSPSMPTFSTALESNVPPSHKINFPIVQGGSLSFENDPPYLLIQLSLGASGA